MIQELSRGQRRRLLRLYRKATNGLVKVRTLIIYRLARGESSVDVERSGLCVRSTVSYVARRFRELGELGLEDGRRYNGKCKATEAVLRRLVELVASRPQDYGWSRPTWTRELLVRQLYAVTGVRLSLATMTYSLRRLGARWGRPKIYVVCPWRKRRRRKHLRQLRQLVENPPADEVALYVDEVDIHLNPKTGPDWMLRAVQKRVRTPGKNVKRYVAGALNSRTGTVIWVEGEHKTSELFIDLLDELCRRYRRYRRIHIIVDNYKVHDCRATERALRRLKGRIVIHFLPPYSPDDNPIEKLWQDLHANVTRNHRCRTIDELMDEVWHYLRSAQPYPGALPSLRQA